MSTGWIVLIVVLVILIGVLVGLYFFGKKAEKKQAAQQEQMDAMAQTVNMLIIDKKKMKLKEANLPSAVLENTPKYLRRTKVPVVKAKVGPRVMTLMCDVKIFDLIPIKKEVKATVSGIYITAVKVFADHSRLRKKQRKKAFLQDSKKTTNKTRALPAENCAAVLFFIQQSRCLWIQYSFGSYNSQAFMIHIQFIIHRTLIVSSETSISIFLVFNPTSI